MGAYWSRSGHKSSAISCCWLQKDGSGSKNDLIDPWPGKARSHAAIPVVNIAPVISRLIHRQALLLMPIWQVGVNELLRDWREDMRTTEGWT